MYFTIQFPIIDHRPLLGLQTLPAPNWSAYTESKRDYIESKKNKEFVHFFGEVRRRWQRTPGCLPGVDELFYATAKRALTFPALEKKRLGKLRPPQGGVRAFFHDSKRGVVHRVEIGVTAELGQADTLDGNDCLVVLRDFLSLPSNVAVACPSSLEYDKYKEGRVRGVIPGPLVMAGDRLARLYMYASTQVGKPVDPGVVSAGEPVVFALYKGDEVRQLTEGSRVFVLGTVDNAQVSYTTLSFQNRLVGVWFVDIDSVSGTTLRKIRLGLGKLHAEHQAMREVLRAYAAHKLDACPELLGFLGARLGLLSSDKKYGIDVQSVRNILNLYGTGEDLNQLDKRIDELRNKPLAKKAQEFLSNRPTERRGGVFVCYCHEDMEAKWLKGIDAFLRPLDCKYFIDTKIVAGANWEEEIRQKLAECRVAVILVSQLFVNSYYIQHVELPELFEAAKLGGVEILPVFVSPTCSNDHPFAHYQGVIDLNTPTKTLEEVGSANKKKVYIALRKRIDKILSIERPP